MVKVPLPSSAVAIVFCGGDPPPAAVGERLPGAAHVIAADSGLHHARALGRHVDLLVGDLDSVDPAELDAAANTGTVVEQHPVDKDATDLELAIVAALEQGARHVTVVGGHGGRLDHFLANVALLASPRFEALTIDGWIGTAYLAVVRGHVELHGAIGSLCTLLAVGGAAHGVTTAGLRFPLDDEVLSAGSTRGVSNELIEPIATVSVRAGTLFAVQPHALDRDAGGVR